MKDWFSIKLGRIIQTASRFYGGGSALPGLVLEKINPDLVGESLQELPYGVVVVSGTNGKTTTTKALVAILEGQGLRVFTNKTGSNFMRGVASAWLSSIDKNGQLQADIAVLELDEAHAVRFTEQILPSYCLLLNVMRDQLDRFGELDNVAQMLNKIAQKTTKAVILNATDSRLQQIGQAILAAKTQSRADKAVFYFGVSPKLLKKLPNLDHLPNLTARSAVTLTAYASQRTELQIGRTTFTFKPQLDGLHNQLNLTAAITAARVILGGKLKAHKLQSSLENLEPAFGRGEIFHIRQRQVKLILVKNPAGFQASLNILNQPTPTLIAINDNYADGRDVSWLWDVDFSKAKITSVMTTGSRSADMALRLKYDDILAPHQPHLRSALRKFINNTSGNVVIFATYTAMLKLRHDLIRMERKNA